jgi:hypothetical protein
MMVYILLHGIHHSLLNFGRHPLSDLNSYLNEEEDNLVQQFIHQTQAELATCHQDVHAKMLTETIR